MPAKVAPKEKEPAKEKTNLFQMALTKGSAQQLEKDEVMDIIFWFRCLVGLSVGLVAGVANFTGYPVVLGYIACLFGMTSVYINKFLEIDEEDYNPQELMMEGMANSGGLFLLSWILVYTYF